MSGQVKIYRRVYLESRGVTSMKPGGAKLRLLLLIYYLIVWQIMKRCQELAQSADNRIYEVCCFLGSFYLYLTDPLKPGLIYNYPRY